METSQYVDIAVSKRKFQRELDDFSKLKSEYIRRGWWLLREEFPIVVFAFATPQLKPPSVPFGLSIDFTNYDFMPPSVRFVDPFTNAPLRANEMVVPPLLRSRAPSPQPSNEQDTETEGQQPAVLAQVQAPGALLQAESPDALPFLCVPGTLEYHEHPGHSGDSWLLHRTQGEGSLYFLLDTVATYSIRPLVAYHVALNLNFQVNGLQYAQGQPPP